MTKLLVAFLLSTAVLSQESNSLGAMGPPIQPMPPPDNSVPLEVPRMYQLSDGTSINLIFVRSITPYLERHLFTSDKQLYIVWLGGCDSYKVTPTEAEDLLKALRNLEQSRELR